MEFAAQSAKGINQDASRDSHLPKELSPIRSAIFQIFICTSCYKIALGELGDNGETLKVIFIFFPWPVR